MQRFFAYFKIANLERLFGTVVAMISCSFCGISAASIFFEVPNGLMSVEGNDASRLPFGYTNAVRYQQVFDSSQFARVPAGGAFLTRIFPREDCSSTFKWIVTNLQINLSTTQKAPDELSAVFAENIGGDDTVVFGPRNYIPPGSTSPSCPDPQPFASGNEISLDTPFYYSRARGNLLLDLRHSGNGWKFGDPPITSHTLDAQTVLGDSVSRVAAFSLTANAAEVMDSTGLVLTFEFDPIPSLTNSLTTNAVVITWPVQPINFALQWADKLARVADWQMYTNEIGGNFFYHVLTLPRDSLDQARFFRLICPSCPPIPQSSPSKANAAINQPTLAQ
jgi:hypothetical protein